MKERLRSGAGRVKRLGHGAQVEELLERVAVLED